jgi:hypothetical protein
MGTVYGRCCRVKTVPGSVPVPISASATIRNCAILRWSARVAARMTPPKSWEMTPLIVGQCHGDGVFAFADKLVVVVASLMGEDHSCALYRDAFAIPHHID